MAVSFWAIFYGRIGSRVGATAAFIIFFVYFLWRAVEPPTGETPRHRATFFTVAAALILGTLTYVYVAGRVGIALVSLFALYLAIFHRRQFRQYDAACWSSASGAPPSPGLSSSISRRIPAPNSGSIYSTPP